MRTASDLVALIADIANRRPIPQGLDGIVVPGTYKSTDGTCWVAVGDTLALPSDGISGPVILQDVQLLTHGVGIQSGPVGMERVLLIPRQSGYAAILEHGEDDSPGAPQGEHWHVIRNPQTGAQLLSMKLTQNGATSNDGKGGLSIIGGTQLQFTTIGGASLTIKDDGSGKSTVTIQTPGGLIITADDTTGEVMIGSLGLTQTQNGIVRQSDLQTAINAVVADYSARFTNLCARIAGGGGVAPPTGSTPTATSSSKVLSE